MVHYKYSNFWHEWKWIIFFAILSISFLVTVAINIEEITKTLNAPTVSYYSVGEKRYIMDDWKCVVDDTFQGATLKILCTNEFTTDIFYTNNFSEHKKWE